MPAETISTEPPAATSLGEKLLDLFVAPGEVFDEIAAAPHRVRNWLVPTALVCLVTAFWPKIFAGASPAPGNEAARMLANALGPIAGTLWSALILWIIGRLFLKTDFSFLKSLEVVALGGMILILGSVVTGLLIVICGDDDARPALSLLLPRTHPADHLRASLDALNLFHLWTTAVLAIGLSRLTGVSFKEAAFWTFGYWVALRLAFILLA